jgi:hypothetical protein
VRFESMTVFLGLLGQDTMDPSSRTPFAYAYIFAKKCKYRGHLTLATEKAKNVVFKHSPIYLPAPNHDHRSSLPSHGAYKHH